MAQKNTNFEVIIVENGSSDDSIKVINQYKHKIKNLNIINILKNIGIGHAIKKGIQEANSDVICYSHADLQIKIYNCIKALKIYKINNNIKTFVKGKRIGRSFIDFVFTKAMAFFNSILFFTYLDDIHAQPNMFSKQEILNVNQIPDDMGIDLFLYIYFKKNKYDIKRFDVNFFQRKHGSGSNDKFSQKIRYMPRAIKSSLQIFLKQI